MFNINVIRVMEINTTVRCDFIHISLAKTTLIGTKHCLGRGKTGN